MRTELVLLQLNIEYGGTGVDFAAVIAAIEVTAAQVVALQEGCGNVPRVAEALGWTYFDNRTQVVSKFPLLDPPNPTAGVVLVEVEPARVAAVVNVHPASRGYGPFRLAKGEPLRRVLRRERRVRLAQLQPSLDAAEDLMRDGIPVILLGDFNAPSHLDWTDDAVGLLPQVSQPVPWPTSIAAEVTGLVDAYRAVFPDPVTHPGLTWPAQRPFVEGYNPAADGHTADRIDFMHVSPDIGVQSIQIVGEQESKFSDLSTTPWPTDHRGLLASLHLEPKAVSPVVSTSHRLVRVGDEVVVRTLPNAPHSLVVVPRGASSDTVLVEIATDASIGHLPTELVGPGVFDVVARDGGRRELARTTLWVAGPGDQIRASTDSRTYGVGDPIEVTWVWSPGNRADWVAVYNRGADPASAKPLLSSATVAMVEGSTSFNAESHPKRWPLAPGEYTVHLLLDDLPVTMAKCDFAVQR